VNNVLHVNGDFYRVTEVLRKLEENSNVRWEDGRLPTQITSSEINNINWLEYIPKEGNVVGMLTNMDKIIEDSLQELGKDDFVKTITQENPKYKDFKHGHIYFGEIYNTLYDEPVLNGLVVFKNNEFCNLMTSYECVNVKNLSSKTFEHELVDVTPKEQLKLLNELQ
jgi:hypothetical protein